VLRGGPVSELEFFEGNGGRPVLDIVEETGPVPSPELPVGPPTTVELPIGNGAVCVDVKELLGGPCTLVPSGAVPVGPARLVELEIGNGALLDPVAERRVLDVGMPVPLTGPVAGRVPVGPT